MIYDTLNNLPNYLGLCSSLDSVIEFIMARDINNLPAGRTRIDGDKAVVMVSTVTPQTGDKAPFVRHDNPPGPLTKPLIPPWAPPAPALPECSARAALPSIWPGSRTNPA